MKISDRLSRLDEIALHPDKMQREALRTLTDVTNGTIDIVDATNPFVFALETSAVNTAAFIQQNKIVNRKLYPQSAVTNEDLYLHMSDKEYLGRFALPSYTYMTILVDKNELLNTLVHNQATGISMITIPRNSVFTIADTKFSLQYPIHIKKMQHGGMMIVYDNSKPSPLYSLESNIIDFDEVVAPDGNALIRFSFKVHQFDVITYNNVVNSASGFVTIADFTDQFYHCRVYVMDDYGDYNEIRTTHSDQIYDVRVPTATLKVVNKSVEVRIPYIYTNTGMIRGNLRIDVYQTKGSVDMRMSNYKIEDFSAEWINIDEKDDTVESAAFSLIRNIIIYSDKTTLGGRDALSFEDLRLRVITNSVGNIDLPITNSQLEAKGLDSGFEIVKNVDTITNRIYLATKEIPYPTSTNLYSSAATSMSRVMSSLSVIHKAHGVRVNEYRIVITSDALYQDNNGVISLVSKEKYNKISAMTRLQLATEVNENIYMYSPFHYVLDISSNKFTSRPYYLDQPKIIYKSFIEDNPNMSVHVNVSDVMNISKTYDGYRLIFKTTSNDVYKSLPDSKVFCQIGYKASNQSVYSYMLGELSLRENEDDERVYVFDMKTDFDINLNNQIAQKSFRFSTTELSDYSDLTQEFHVLFLTTDEENSTKGMIDSDSMVGLFQLPNNVKVISHEKIKIEFGKHMDSLWSRTKSVASVIEYQTYSEDVYATYSEDVYDVDPVTGNHFTVDKTTGKLVYLLLHKKGDFILDSSKNKILIHPKGSVVLDENAQPIPAANYTDSITRFIDIMTIDAAYKFATDSISLEYKDQIEDSLIEWINVDVPKLNDRLLEQSKIYFYPKSTYGWIECNVGDNKTVVLNASQEFKITLYVPKVTYDNTSLLVELENITKRTLREMLSSNTISIDAIQVKLRELYGADVTGVKISSLDNKYNTLTLVDKSTRFNIKKNLNVLPNKEIVVTDAIYFEYVVMDSVY